mmetsp:Transcript_38509/g.62085  ORF Transcript_38509/g.62085 Transcript_38509/m.62085 type:complete len:251 (+) Transcript_38509:162-914(+)
MWRGCNGSPSVSSSPHSRRTSRALSTSCPTSTFAIPLIVKIIGALSWLSGTSAIEAINAFVSLSFKFARRMAVYRCQSASLLSWLWKRILRCSCISLYLSSVARSSFSSSSSSSSASSLGSFSPSPSPSCPPALSLSSFAAGVFDPSPSVFLSPAPGFFAPPDFFFFFAGVPSSPAAFGCLSAASLLRFFPLTLVSAAGFLPGRLEGDEAGKLAGEEVRAKAVVAGFTSSSFASISLNSDYRQRCCESVS